MKFYKIVSKKDFEYFYKWIYKDYIHQGGIDELNKHDYPQRYPCLVCYNFIVEYEYGNHFDFDYIYQENGEWDLKIKENWGDMKEESEES